MFSATISMIATSEGEIESLTLKMVGTVSLLRVIAIKPRSGERVRDAVRQANSRICEHNAKVYGSEPVEPAQKVLTRFLRSGTFPGNQILKRQHLRGQF